MWGSESKRGLIGLAPNQSGLGDVIVIDRTHQG